MIKKQAVFLGLAAVVLVSVAAAAGAFVTQKSMVPDEKPVVQKTAQRKTAHKEQIVWNEPARPAAQPVRQAPPCNDGNIVGTALGGLAGGVAGSQIGKGSGKTAATIGGTLGGAYVGNQFIPTRNVTCR